MSDYLHWIGKKYYTMNSFAKEAEEHRVTRRVSLNVAKKMSWGDRIYTAMLDGKTGVIFGYFDIDRITGLSSEALDSVTSAYENEQVAEGGRLIERACGEYSLGATHTVASELPAIIDILQEKVIDDRDIGNPMIGGNFHTITAIRLMNIPFRQGFRTFDAGALLHEAAHYHGKVYGQFYVPLEEADPFFSSHRKECGWVQAVENYQKKKKGRK